MLIEVLSDKLQQIEFISKIYSSDFEFYTTKTLLDFLFYLSLHKRFFSHPNQSVYWDVFLSFCKARFKNFKRIIFGFKRTKSGFDTKLNRRKFDECFPKFLLTQIDVLTSPFEFVFIIISVICTQTSEDATLPYPDFTVLL